MDAYLAIAEKILLQTRRPLGAREILRIAYPSGKVPRHLYGKTQHKTLGARLAEDILERGDRSLFYRNEPGRYFLTQFLDDETIPSQYRQRFVARRRRRQLAQPKPLALTLRDLPAPNRDRSIPVEAILDLLIRGIYHYPSSTKTAGPEDVIVWSFVIVARGSRVLTYRHGEYREERDSFRNRRAIGFYAPVLEGDRTLFDLDDHGIVHRGISTISIDLGLTTQVDLVGPGSRIATLESFITLSEPGRTSLLSVIRFEAPEWFEPYARRLAINDLQWIDFAIPRNHAEDFDPWSAAVMAASFRAEAPRIQRRG
jgi:hypothetical protein